MVDGYKMLNILVVEDDHIDFEVIKRALNRSDIKCIIHHAETGVIALKKLRGEDGESKITSPMILLADINMPLMNGIDMIKEIRADLKLQHNIIFILTTSAHHQDIVESYKLNIAGYFLKENIDYLISTLRPYCEKNQFPD